MFQLLFAPEPTLSHRVFKFVGIRLALNNRRTRDQRPGHRHGEHNAMGRRKGERLAGEPGAIAYMVAEHFVPRRRSLRSMVALIQREHKSDFNADGRRYACGKNHVTSIASCSKERESQDAECEPSALNARNNCKAFRKLRARCISLMRRTNASMKPSLCMRSSKSISREIIS